MPKAFSGDKQLPFKTVGLLIEEGIKLPQIEELKWEKGQGAKQTAYLCFSSGTSGLPVSILPKFCIKPIHADSAQKGVKISHHNVIANVMQIVEYEKPFRPADYTECVLGLLPLSHIYGLVVIAQAGTYRGDGVIILPRFEIQSYLGAIQDYKIQGLFLVSSLAEVCGHLH